MWENPAIEKNLETLKSRGVKVVEPESGFLACGTNGTGRMVEIEDIYEKTVEILSQKKNLAGKKVLITGKGRCNITNSLPWKDFSHHIHPDHSFLKNAFILSGEEAFAHFQSFVP